MNHETAIFGGDDDAYNRPDDSDHNKNDQVNARVVLADDLILACLNDFLALNALISLGGLCWLDLYLNVLQADCILRLRR